MPQVPVGRATLGRIINVIGEAIDERGDISKLVSPFKRCQSFCFMHSFCMKLSVLFCMHLESGHHSMSLFNAADL
jgi:hypothetical protein